jgi:hypothetical protein
MGGMTTDAVTPGHQRNSSPGAVVQDVATITLREYKACRSPGNRLVVLVGQRDLVQSGSGALRCNTSWCNHKALRRARSATVDSGSCW